MPLVHAVMSDSDGSCTYFTVYTPMHAVPPDLGKKLAGWEPALSSVHKAQNSVVPEQPQTPPPAVTGALPPPPAIVVMRSTQPGNGEEQAPLPRPKPPIIMARKGTTLSKPKEPHRSLAPAAASTPRVPIAGSAQSP
jgi:hypothetical protein